RRTHAAMITWRPPLLFGIGLATLWVWPDPWLALLILLGAILLASIVDLLLTPAPSALRLARSGGKAVRIGEETEVHLEVTNPTEYAYRLRVRDAWVPSAGATPYQHALDLEPDETAVLTTTLRPTRRGDRPAVRVTLRAYGPLGLSFRQLGHARAD